MHGTKNSRSEQAGGAPAPIVSFLDGSVMDFPPILTAANLAPV